jgi:hypothetical protein
VRSPFIPADNANECDANHRMKFSDLIASDDGSINCGFDSFDACARAVSGVGGVCRISTFDDIDAHATAHPADRNAL